VSLPLVKALQQCQSVTAARISASRCGRYQLGVKPCTSSPWSWAKVTSTMGSEEHHDASHTTSSTSAHRNLKRREYWSGKVPTAAGLTISAPSQTAPAGPAPGASNRRLRRCSYAPALSRSQAATGRRHDVNKVLPRVLSASTGGGITNPASLQDQCSWSSVTFVLDRGYGAAALSPTLLRIGNDAIRTSPQGSLAAIAPALLTAGRNHRCSSSCARP